MKRFMGLAVLAILVVGCDTLPSGPGEITGSVQSQNASLGGAVLEIVATGVEGFSGVGGTKVFWAPQEDPVVFRVIVIGEGGGDLKFSISMQDRSDRTPRGSVVLLTDLNNRPVPVTSDYDVRFTR